MIDLASKKCVPYKTGEGRLDIKKIKEYLPAVPEWLLIGDTIQKELRFKDFKQSMNFVNKVAEIAEVENHHPDIYVFYNKVRLILSTHAAKGLTENDFILAAKINGIPSADKFTSLT